MSFGKSTLQLFRAQLILHDQVRAVFQHSRESTREPECLQGRKMKVVLDTTPFLGRGAGRRLVARVARPHNQGQFPEQAFTIDLESKTCTCPAGELTQTIVPLGTRKDRRGQTVGLRALRFLAEVCQRCPLRPADLRARPGHGRTVMIHPQERLLQAGVPLREYQGKRQAAEHRLATLVRLGIPESRYFGRVKTLSQLILASTVACLTLTATKTNRMSGPSGAKPLQSLPLPVPRRRPKGLPAIRLGPPLATRASFRCSRPGFRPGFQGTM